MTTVPLPRRRPGFALPPDGEASAPPESRGVARDGVRMLLAAPGRVEHRVVRDLPELLAPGDLVVVNTSATLPAAMLPALSVPQKVTTQPAATGVPLNVRLLTTLASPFSPAWNEVSVSLPRPSKFSNPSEKLESISIRGWARRKLLAGQFKPWLPIGPLTCGRRAVTPMSTKARKVSSRQAPSVRPGDDAAIFPANPPERLPRPSSAKPIRP